MRAMALMLVLGTLLALTPVVSATPPGNETTTCSTTTVGIGVVTVATVRDPSDGCDASATVYACDVDWFGGRGLLGGFVIECYPLVSGP